MFIRLIQQYFNFSKKEALGFIIIGAIMVIALFLPFFMSFIISSHGKISDRDIQMLDSLMATMENKSSPVFFDFDPNTLNKDSLFKLGLGPVTVDNILKYRKADGVFKYKKDFKKIYGLSEEIYTKLKPYIRLPEYSDPSKDMGQFQEVEKAPEEDVEIEKVNLNTADASQLQNIKGIGEVYSERIVKYRYILGGFVDKSQLNEVYGISDLAFKNIMKQGIIEEGFVPEKLNVNELKKYALQYHPYISADLASDIVGIRERDIHLKSGQDLKEFLNIDDSVLVKLLPYIEFE